MTSIVHMRLALRLARRACGSTSPNPMVGAVLVKSGRIIGRGWHRKAGSPHAEIEALSDARKRGHSTRGATLYVTLEPCCTHGRTPPCTEAIVKAAIRRVVVGAIDPNPNHAGKAFALLEQAGINVAHGVIAPECSRLNEAFNHWIVHGTPFVTVKTAMTLDGKIATASGESKWITGEQAREQGMNLRSVNDAILVGINTILADDPSLTRRGKPKPSNARTVDHVRQLKRIVLDTHARTPLTARVVSDAQAGSTIIVVGQAASPRRVAKLAQKVQVWIAPAAKSSTGSSKSKIDLHWLMQRLGKEDIVSLLVEGGGEVNASFFETKLAHRVAFFYAPKILGGRESRHAVGGKGASNWTEIVQLDEIKWKHLGVDLLMTARVQR